MRRARSRMAEIPLPVGRRLYVYCAVGLRGYLACRQLAQAGHDATNVAGGFRSYKDFKAAGLAGGGSGSDAAKL